MLDFSSGLNKTKSNVNQKNIKLQVNANVKRITGRPRKVDVSQMNQIFKSE